VSSERAASLEPPDADGPVTTTVTRRVKPGHEAAYEEVLEGFIAAASRFKGHLGVEVFRPDRPGGEYRTVYRFDSAEHLRRWLASDERAAWLGRAEAHAAEPMRTRYLTGLESWFTLPSQPGAVPPPPPYKMALLTWITITPLITGVVLTLDPLLDDFALVPRLAITTAVTVPLMTWVVMPRVTRALRRWLYP
jgi:antibiotic biosynthesis monooxygenase (ABM) superfamily enzyme